MPDVELLYLMLSLAAATLVSEDLSCITAGLMVSQGRLSLLAASVACFLGILIGDMLLYFAGRYLGRPALKHRPLRWFVQADAVDRASAWFCRRGLAVIFISRFTPGLRLPTYFAAGVLRTNPLNFLLYFSLACLLWAPSLVWLASSFGESAEFLLHKFEDNAFWVLIGLGLLIFTMTRIVVPLFTWRGRRLLAGAWLRQRRWEYWPRWRFYGPILPTILWQAIRHNSLTLVSAVNPELEGGGLAGESKAAMFAKLSGPGVPPYSLFPASINPQGATRKLNDWMSETKIDFPIVLKPDAGERGSGVVIVGDLAAALDWFESQHRAAIAQPLISGLEFGVSYLRFPSAEKGKVVSIAAKEPPTVEGDGISTIEQLILQHPRHVATAQALFAAQSTQLFDIPAAGKEIVLSPLGTHNRGAAFLDRNHLHTPQLEAAIEEISRRCDGFYLGRYDIRVPSIEDLQAGRNLQVLELNGLTGEPAHIYDPQHSVAYARGVLRQLWRDAFAIAAANRSADAESTSIRELIRLWRESR
jgi:membrane protein DedA with SNARE-associated domain